jgi:hypothetical protein
MGCEMLITTTIASSGSLPRPGVKFQHPNSNWQRSHSVKETIMENPIQRSTSTLDSSLRRLVVALTLLGALMFGAQVAQAQTFTVLHNFTGGLDGSSPYAGLSMDGGGNLYGTTSAGGTGYGAVFELSRKGSGWVFHPLYSFAGGTDGEGPVARVIMGPNGTLYGTTYAGGVPGCSGGYGCGTVFNLRPSPIVCRAVLCSWVETVLYSFNGDSDGANPLLGDIVFDQSGNLYGTTENGGGVGCSGSRMWHGFRVVARRRRLDGKDSLQLYWSRKRWSEPVRRSDF